MMVYDDAPCRSCGAPLKTVFADLGLSPISNALVGAEGLKRPELFYPLRAFACDRCFLVQVQDIESREAHFHADYVYFSSYSRTWLEHARRFATLAVDRFALQPASRVVEVGSNDGYLLQFFSKQNIPVLGVDPAANCAQAAWDQHGIRTAVAFFGADTAQKLRAEAGPADLIVANNVLAHVPNLHDFIAGLRILLKPGGAISIEFPHLLELIRQAQFDTIYHEHYSYPSLVAVLPLFSRHGLIATDVERLQTHGGSLRVYLAHETDGQEVRASVRELVREEQDNGLGRIETYELFRSRPAAVKQQLLALLIDRKKQGRRIAAYGAPAKGNTLLNYCGIRSDMIDFTVDRSVHKQGKFLPGSRIPILAPEAIFEHRPDDILILPWNLSAEIMAQLQEVAGWGGAFILPIPVPTAIEAAAAG